MPNSDEAREQAWREDADYAATLYDTYVKGWDARGQHDEQRIAALVALYSSLREQYVAVTELLREGAFYGDVTVQLMERSLAAVESDAALRALAGQTARDESR